MKKTAVKVGDYYDVQKDKTTSKNKTIPKGTILRCTSIRTERKRGLWSHEYRNYEYPVFCDINNPSTTFEFDDHSGIEPSSYVGNDRKFELLKVKDQIKQTKSAIKQAEIQVKKANIEKKQLEEEQKRLEGRAWALENFESDEAEIEYKIDKIMASVDLTPEERREQLRELLS